jgi:tetratricopeptide (TPR) repeat protein
MSAPGQPDRYEIFHDMLAPAILDWRRRFSEQQAQELIRRQEQQRWAREHEEAERKQERERARWLRRGILGLIALVVILVAAIVSILYQQRKWNLAVGERDKVERDLIKVRADNVRAAQELQTRIRKAGDLIREGQLDVQARNYDVAIGKLDKAIEIDPKNPNALNMKGYAQLRKGDTKTAVQTLEAAVALDPQYPWGHYNLALAYWAEGDQEKALSEVRKTIEADPAFRTRFKTDGQFNKFKVMPEYRALIEP